MNVDRIAQVSTYQSTLKTQTELETKTLKLANNQIKAEGEASLKLLESAASVSGSLGSNINVKV